MTVDIYIWIHYTYTMAKNRGASLPFLFRARTESGESFGTSDELYIESCTNGKYARMAHNRVDSNTMYALYMLSRNDTATTNLSINFRTTNYTYTYTMPVSDAGTVSSGKNSQGVSTTFVLNGYTSTGTLYAGVYDGTRTSYNSSVYASGGNKLYGAAYNDFAEFRDISGLFPLPGQCVYEVGDDTIRVTDKRLIHACHIVSDTYGMALGKEQETTSPISISGRVLAIPYEDRSLFEVGMPVCSGPNGTVSIMTREEMINYPNCIVGFVSCVPTYTNWGENNTEVGNRVWVKIK